jgi:hypothetical protein
MSARKSLSFGFVGACYAPTWWLSLKEKIPPLLLIKATQGVSFCFLDQLGQAERNCPQTRHPIIVSQRNGSFCVSRFSVMNASKSTVFPFKAHYFLS